MEAEKKSLRDAIGHRIFANPLVAQLWAKFVSRRAMALKNNESNIPFTLLNKPLQECRLALITTGGIHLVDQKPYDMQNPDGDASYREIPGDVNLGDLKITHRYYDHRDADKDLNVIFPLERFRELVAKGIVGAMAGRHYGFMGHIDGAQLPILINETAPGVARELKNDGVDFVFLTPA